MSATCEAKFVIIRSTYAGVHAGYLGKRKGKEVMLLNSRRLWYWKGAASLSQLAMEGVKNPSECKFAMSLPEIVITDAVEIIPCSAVAEANIKAVPEWKM